MADSPRLSLARVARDTALADPGVHALDSGLGGVRCTVSGTERVEGVVSAAEGGAGYSLELHVVALPEDLHALGDRLRAGVRHAADDQGLGERLATVSVRGQDVVAP